MRATRVLLVSALLAPAVSVAQSVRGTVTAKSTGEPVAGSIVALLDTTGRAVATMLATDAGAFLITAPAPGRYTLRVERVGFRSASSHVLMLQASDTLHFSIAMSGEGVSLRAVEVTADRRCVLRPQEGLATAQLWDESRKALSATRLTQMAQAAGSPRGGARPFSVRLRRFVRELNPTTLERRRNEEFDREGRSVTPFASRDPALLDRDGYLATDAQGTSTYFAPDATVLLSDLFLDSHCFRVQAPGRDRNGDLIGLAFEPVARAHGEDRGDAERSRVDVRGVLWLDRGSAELRYMEYGYTNLRLDVPTEHLGGLVEFRPLPDGRWIVWHWYIRMPRIERRALQRLTPGPTQEYRNILVAIQEEGGEVIELLPEGARVRSLATVAGTVVDSLRQAPARGIRVFLSGTSFAAVTGADGSYRIDSVPPGLYSASIIAASLDSMLLEAPVQRLTASAGVETRTDFGLPSLQSITSRLCKGESPPAADSAAIAFGVVRDTSGALVIGAPVTANWQRFSKQAMGAKSERLVASGVNAETKSIAGGHYALCGLPAGELLTLRAKQGSALGEVTGVRLQRAEIRRVDLRIKQR